MNSHTVSAILLSGLFATGLTACDGSGSDEATATAQSGMGEISAENAAPDSAVTHMAEGTLNSVNLASGTVNISHGPVPTANWPEMTMGFRLADPDSARDLEPGQQIRFEFTIESGMSATVTRIEEIE